MRGSFPLNGTYFQVNEVSFLPRSANVSLSVSDLDDHQCPCKVGQDGGTSDSKIHEHALSSQNVHKKIYKHQRWVDHNENSHIRAVSYCGGTQRSVMVIISQEGCKRCGVRYGFVWYQTSCLKT
ncbi:hypothetical protein KSP40_PGU001818 [Platanthera guangdongensis]|uniref:Uncharacterized protein n=1 Tax=Platanthera guangdongensis TaxID=2320717 RepID=A0ABR2MTU8_9ASPA